MADTEEDIFDSWEDAADSGELERRMEERQKDLKAREKLTLDVETNSKQGPITILKAENSGRTEYTPQIKILKRSPNASPMKKRLKNKTEDEMKQTLKQKEADYMAARERILGKDYDETKPKLDNDDNVRISIIKNPSRTSSPVLSPTRTVLPSSTECIVREPNGPDSSGGFKIGR